MTHLLVLAGRLIVWAADPSPTPSAGPIDENLVTPGVVGFGVTFFVAAATVLLLVDMSRRMRRVRYRGEIREQLEAERLEAEAAAAKGTSAKGASAKGKKS